MGWPGDAYHIMAMPPVHFQYETLMSPLHGFCISTYTAKCKHYALNLCPKEHDPKLWYFFFSMFVYVCKVA